MPIRINLLAEAHELEEERRRDPVKRAIYVACGIVALFLVWGASKEVLIFAQKSRLKDLEAQVDNTATNYARVSASKQQLDKIRLKLTKLTELTTNRLLNGSLLNALQKAAADDIQVTHLKVNQSYTATKAVKPKHDPATGHTTPGKPATETEHITVSVEARDNSLRPGEEALNNWRQKLGDVDYFRQLLGNTNQFRLMMRSAPQFPPGSQKPFVNFTLEAQVPDRVR